MNNRHQIVEEIPLSRVIFRPIEAYNQQMGGLDTLIFGYLLTPSSKYDSMFNDVLRNHLFQAEKLDHQGRLYKQKKINLIIYFILVQTKRFDLSAININRGRDHGLPSKYTK